jgi:hypothetical protein
LTKLIFVDLSQNDLIGKIQFKNLLSQNITWIVHHVRWQKENPIIDIHEPLQNLSLNSICNFISNTYSLRPTKSVHFDYFSLLEVWPNL